MDVRKKLLFFCAKLGGGGAEMHLVRVLNCIPQDKFEVYLALTRPGGNYESFLEQGIQVHHLSKTIESSLGSLLLSMFPLIRLVRKIDPAYVISVMDIQNLLACNVQFLWRGVSGAKLILCCQVAPSKDLQAHPIGKMVATLIPSAYPKANGIIAISKGVKDDLKRNFNVFTPMEVVYNAGLDKSIEQKKEEPLNLPKGVYHLVAVGRLTKQKGFDVLLEALALVQKQIDFHCTIIGEGPERKNLELQRNKLRLSSKVSLPGFQENPYAYYAKADVFVLSSRWEGFGNVIVEAMACETPVIATRCDFGPDEIIEHGKNGLLVNVEEPQALADAIALLLSNPELRQELAAEGLQRAKDFSDEKISLEYLNAILSF